MANNILANKKINLVLRLLLHFLVSSLLFFGVTVIGGGLANSGFATIIMMFIYVLIYIIFAIVFVLISKRKNNKNNENETYSNVFK